MLSGFSEDLRNACLTVPVLYWDDTVAMMNKIRGCIRFYGNERLAFFTAHERKDMAGLDEDQVLQNLTSATKVMHDHNKVNYNAKYCFVNLECNQHLQRDLQEVTDNLQHKWSNDPKELISQTINERNKLIKIGAQLFSENEKDRFWNSFYSIVAAGRIENKSAGDLYFTHDEQVLLDRIEKYKNNYFS